MHEHNLKCVKCLCTRLITRDVIMRVYFRRTAMLNFAVSIIRGFTVSLGDTRFAIVKFSSSAKVEAYLNTFDNTQDLIEYALNHDVTSC